LVYRYYIHKYMIIFIEIILLCKNVVIYDEEQEKKLKHLYSYRYVTH